MEASSKKRRPPNEPKLTGWLDGLNRALYGGSPFNGLQRTRGHDSLTPSMALAGVIGFLAAGRTIWVWQSPYPSPGHRAAVGNLSATRSSGSNGAWSARFRGINRRAG